MDKLKRHWFSYVLLLMCVAMALFLWEPWESGQTTMKSFGEAPDFQLENTEGHKVSLDNTEGKVRLVYFFFSHCPDVCIPTTAMLSRLQAELKSRDLFASGTALISISFDPERDTKEQLKQFSAIYNADPQGWSFLRGDEAYTRQLALDYKISVIKDDNGNFLHQNRFILIDADRELRQWYDANDPELSVEQIATDMERLAK